jgi:flagellar hook-length control protein FliK
LNEENAETEPAMNATPLLSLLNPTAAAPRTATALPMPALLADTGVAPTRGFSEALRDARDIGTPPNESRISELAAARRGEPQPERPSERTSDRAAERTSDRAAERTSDRAAERTSDRAAERTSDRAADRAAERINEQRRASAEETRDESQGNAQGDSQDEAPRRSEPAARRPARDAAAARAARASQTAGDATAEPAGTARRSTDHLAPTGEEATAVDEAADPTLAKAGEADEAASAAMPPELAWRAQTAAAGKLETRNEGAATRRTLGKLGTLDRLDDGAAGPLEGARLAADRAGTVDAPGPGTERRSLGTDNTRGKAELDAASLTSFAAARHTLAREALEGARNAGALEAINAAPNASAALAGLAGLSAMGALAAPTSAHTTTDTRDAHIGAAVGSPAFADELGTQLTFFARDGVQQARLQLNPQELGPVFVRIQLEGQAAQVHLAADQAQTRQALEQALPALAGQLSESGITLTGGGVSDQTARQFQADGQGNARPNAQGDRTAGRDTDHGRDDGSARDVPGTAQSAVARGWQARGIVDLIA